MTFNKNNERIVVAEWSTSPAWVQGRYGSERIICTTRLIATDDNISTDGTPEWRLVSEGDKFVQLLHNGNQTSNGPRYGTYWSGSEVNAERLAAMVETPAAV